MASIPRLFLTAFVLKLALTAIAVGACWKMSEAPKERQGRILAVALISFSLLMLLVEFGPTAGF